MLTQTGSRVHSLADLAVYLLKYELSWELRGSEEKMTQEEKNVPPGNQIIIYTEI